MQTPTLTAPEAQNRTTFLSMMNALSRPGELFELDLANDFLPHNLLAIGETLLDLETTFYTPDAKLSESLAHTLARPETPSVAAYQFYPILTPKLLETLATAPVGEMNYPDRGATIILGCRFNCGPTLTLTGPGIETETIIQVNSLPPNLWDLRAEKIQYPLGWDIFLVHENKVMGLPRTTEISVTR